MQAGNNSQKFESLNEKTDAVIDPGIVTAAITAGSLFDAINKLEAISNNKAVPHPLDAHIEFGLTFNIRNIAQDKAKICHENTSSITFLATDLDVPNTSFENLQGPTTRNWMQRERFVVSIDEYKSTVTCSSCFQRTTQQRQNRHGKVKKILGVVVCFNSKCPRQVSTSATIINREHSFSRRFDFDNISHSKM
ncbi:hypothetical protein [Parasitella parasitica]|uniref:Uncharacterized protein n=1 Tax=Parasitella parasitica TaxID=35722 RepID=A0A0B7N4W2_9FUNG|nr:hypothetical protein [Parasitella parasitica]